MLLVQSPGSVGFRAVACDAQLWCWCCDINPPTRSACVGVYVMAMKSGYYGLGVKDTRSVSGKVRSTMVMSSVKVLED